MRELAQEGSDRRASVTTSCVLTHPGRVRLENQDRVGRAALASERMVVVADGVGGEAGGAMAADLAVQGYLALLSAPAKEGTDEAPEYALQRATQAIQQEIADVRGSDFALKGMASTVVVLYLREAVATVGHLGDARAYLLRAGQLRRLTEDHSVVQRMVRDGLLSQAEAVHHPQGHILTRSLGQAEMLLQIQAVPVQEGDLFLLCSDGLWACLSEELLLQEMQAPPAELAPVAQRLLDCALQAGAPDNVSVGLLRVGEPEPAAVNVSCIPSARNGEPPSASHARRYLLPALLLVAAACALAWWFVKQAAR